MNSSLHLAFTRSVAALSLLLPLSTQAGDYYLQSSMSGTTNWTNSSSWFSSPSGGGANPTTFAGHHFWTNGWNLRLNATTFGGASLRTGPVYPNTQHKLIMKYASGTATIPVLFSEGGVEINQGQGDAITTTLQVNTFHNKIGTDLGTENSTRGLTLSIGTLSGSGDFRLLGGGKIKFGATTATGFTGDITWATTYPTQLEFSNNLISGGRLIVSANGRVKLNKDVTFRGVVINGTALAAGTYDYDDLLVSHNAQFLGSTAGKIVVLSGPVPDLDLTGYNLSFSDEFDGPLSVSDWGYNTKWISHKPDNGDHGLGLFQYLPPHYVPCTVSGGILSMKGWKSTVDGRWHAGNLSSLAKDGYGFAQRYGYFEARMKLSGKSFGWPAFWLLSTGTFEEPSIRTAELDVMEYYGDQTNVAHTTTHRHGSDPGKILQFTTVSGMTSAFHDYGVLVKPDSITYFIDGRKIHQVPNYPEAQTPLFPLVSHALKWDAGEEPAASETSVTTVEYVRVYEAPTSITGVIPRTSYTVTADGQDSTHTSAKAIDGNYLTHWLSAPGVPKPHQIKITLPTPQTVVGLRYLPRQSTGTLDGLIRNYEVKVSADNVNWVTADSGTWSASPLEKVSSFDVATDNIRYVILKDVGTGTLTAAAEVRVITPSVVSLDKTITGFSSQHTNTYFAASNINDGKTDSATKTDPRRGWASVSGSGTRNEWVTMDLGKEHTLTSLLLKNEDSYDDRNAKDFVLYGSAKGAFTGEEFVIASGTFPSLDRLGTHKVEFADKKARFLKFKATSSYSSYVIVGELSVFGF